MYDLGQKSLYIEITDNLVTRAESERNLIVRHALI